MKPFSFADILFLFLTLVITFTILWFVNKAKGKRKGTEGKGQSCPDVTPADDGENS